MKNRTYLWKSLMLAVIMALTLALPAYAEEANEALYVDDLEYRVLEVYELLKNLHVSGVDTETLSEASIKGMLQAVDDPYTSFMTVEEWEAFQNTIDQQYTGLGIVVTKIPEGIAIERVIPGSPGEAAGLMAGDRVLSVAGQPVTEQMTLDEMVALIPKEENAEVELSVGRGEETLQIKATVKKVTVPVATGKLLQGGIGYIELTMFSTESAAEFSKIMEQWKNESIRGLVIDLRDNPGGLLDASVEIAKHFVKEGVIVQTQDRSGKKAEIKVDGGSEVSYPVVLLVNENSASASELLSGALRDHGKATIVGTKTFGKGSVQASYELSDGSVLKLTIEEYLTPKSDKVNGVGITPDVHAEGDLPQLLTALRTAGADNLQVSQSEGQAVRINGVEFAGSVPVLREEGRTFVHSRILASLAGGTIEWKADRQMVEMTLDGHAVQFPLGAEMKMKEDMTYIELNAFKQSYGKFDWSDEAGQLTLTIS
ncbi:S41 family peptidase [Paenibacillus sp. 32O-W]|uniref:S41 family peptidase n=1 Tax=Paenibacillus sp. 32O-W TaxID=1695218 RepID=UPI00119DE3F0|nr:MULTISPECIES: S41 family peptidase [Paenibacillaceae]